MELSALEDANNLEYEKFVRDWERRRAELNSNISEQHNLSKFKRNKFEQRIARVTKQQQYSHGKAA
eukprot:scaffold21762_cov20-Tisochrysis_lutea.AAC.3